MDQAKYEPTFEESIKQVMQTLPQNIRTYISQEKYTAVVKNLMSKYNLHIDQGGVLEREIILLLMGIESPEEFTQALFEEVRINKQIISSIAKDANDQIFIPLREEMRKSGGGNAPITGSVKPLVQSVPVSPKTNAPNTEQKSHFNLQNKINPPPRQIHSDIKPPVPRVNPPLQSVLSRPVSLGGFTPKLGVMSVRPVLETQKPPKSNTLLEDREEPSPSLKAVERKDVSIPTPVSASRIGFNNVPKPPIPSTVTNIASPLRAALEKVLPGSGVPVPQKVSAPKSFVVRTTASELMPNLPGAMPPVPARQSRDAVQPPPVAAPPKEVPVPPRIPPQQKPISAPIKSYSSDPYREPIE